MSNGKLFGSWSPIEDLNDPSQVPHAIIAAMPRGINSRVLTVGPPESAPPDFSRNYGIPVNYTSIAAAMATIPLPPGPDTPADQRTILVTPGVYHEVIRFKPGVNVVGLVKEAVIIAGEPEHHSGVRAQVFLCTRSLLTNVTLHISERSEQGDFAVRGYDTNKYTNHNVERENVRFLGLFNVDFQNASGHPLPAGGLIKFEGNDWRTVIFRDVGGNYDAPKDYGIELKGHFQNADCHFINCFFDALFLNDEGGFIHIEDCHEVHIRNSLIRVDYLKTLRALRTNSPITAVKTTSSSGSSDKQWTHVLIEGSSLYGRGGSVLNVGENTVCFFRHSFTDSKTGTGTFKASAPDGIGNA
jgi:hypothetical protein